MKKLFVRLLRITLSVSLSLFVAWNGGGAWVGMDASLQNEIVAFAQTSESTESTGDTEATETTATDSGASETENPQTETVWWEMDDGVSSQRLQWILVGSGAGLMLVGLIGALITVCYRKRRKKITREKKIIKGRRIV